MVDLLAGPYFGCEWKIVLDAQCRSGGFDEFLSAMDWLVLQLGGRSTYTENEWPNFAMAGLLPGPYWPLLWARVTASAVMAVFIAHWCQDPNPDFRLRHGGCIATGTEGDVEAIVWFGFRVLGCRSTAKGAPWASFRSLSGFGEKKLGKKNENHTGAHWGYGNSANPFLSAAFFGPSLLPRSPGRFIFRWGV